MNIQNVVMLGMQMQSLGFGDASGLLLRRICFNPDNFYLPQTIVKDGGQLLFALYFEKQGMEGQYSLQYYDVTLQKDNAISALRSGNTDLTELEKQMSAIEWQKAFDLDSVKPFDAEDKSTWETEAKVASVTNSLRLLEKNEQTKAFANYLKFKHWTGSFYQQLFTSIVPAKSKFDISQRFYFSESGNTITVDEAYRFLQNKWVERQIRQKKKLPDDASQTEMENGKASSNRGLLQKRRVNHSGKRKLRKANTEL